MTGSVPGIPRQMGQTCALGNAPKALALHPQNILLAVSNSTWTSMPMTGSYGITASWKVYRTDISLYASQQNVQLIFTMKKLSQRVALAEFSKPNGHLRPVT